MPQSTQADTIAADADFNEAIDGLIANLVASYSDPAGEHYHEGDALRVLSALGTITMRTAAQAALRLNAMPEIDAPTIAYNVAVNLAQSAGRAVGMLPPAYHLQALLACGEAMTRETRTPL